jgi:hypothetical protein
MADFRSQTCADSNLEEVEQDLAVNGSRLVAKADQKELLLKNYMKSSHSGTPTSFARLGEATRLEESQIKTPSQQCPLSPRRVRQSFT